MLDLYCRRIVGWSMQSQMAAQRVTDALLMAIWRRNPGTALLHHSDQGSQYTAESFQRLLADQGVTCSMSRKGEFLRHPQEGAHEPRAVPYPRRSPGRCV